MAKRIEIDEAMLEGVTGGSIGVSPDYTTCGYNCNNQYKINDLNGFINYYSANMKMDERDILRNAAVQGFLTAL